MLPLPDRLLSMPPDPGDEPVAGADMLDDVAAVGLRDPREEPLASGSLDLPGPTGLLHVWLGGTTQPTALEADVRAVSAACLPRAATAMALGEVARRHRLEVRILPRVHDHGRCLLVLFGKRVHGFRR